MRTSLICAAAALLFLASCNKNDMIESQNVSIDNTIKVEAIINSNPPTKASAVVTDQNNISSFSMYMYNDGEALAEGVKFSKPSVAGDPWTHSGIYYWAAGEYDFFGVAQDNSADNAISQVNVTEDGISIGTNASPYVIVTDGETDEPAWDASAGAYVGGIYGDAVASSDQPDPVVAAETVTRNDDNTGGKISTMNFYHALSRVRVSFNSYDPKSSNLKLVVLGYEFRQVGVEGYTTQPIASSTDASSVDWTIKTKGMVRENSVDVPDEFDSSWTGTSKSLIPDDSWCNVIPGDVATALVVKAALYDNTDNYVACRYLTTASEDVMKAAGLKVSGTSTYAYQPGYQYTYTVEVTSDGGADTDYPQNPGLDDPNHDGPDDDLEGLVIKVTSVTVQDWQDAQGGTAVFTGEE